MITKRIPPYNCYLQIELDPAKARKVAGLEDDAQVQGFVCDGGEGIQYIHVNPFDPVCMSHEAAHAAINIMHFIRAEVNQETHEQFAYLVGYIVELCMEQADKMIRKGKLTPEMFGMEEVDENANAGA